MREDFQLRDILGDADTADAMARFYRPRTTLPPELLLFKAILELGIYEGDLEWINARDEDWVFSFESVCGALGIDASAARAALNRGIKRPQKTVVVRQYRSRMGKILDIPGRVFDHGYGECGHTSKCKQCIDRYHFTRRKRRWQRAKHQLVVSRAQAERMRAAGSGQQAAGS